jgi:hypothetical protein
MPKKKLSKAEGIRLLKNTNQRLRFQQEARTIARIEQLDIEACEKLGRQLQLEHSELSGELECPDTDTVRQYTLDLSDSEEPHKRTKRFISLLIFSLLVLIYGWNPSSTMNPSDTDPR